MRVSVRNRSSFLHRAVASLAAICPSSWVSWGCYGVGLMLALTPQAAADLTSGGAGFAILFGSIVMFFLSAILIQHSMRLSLLSNSFGQPNRLMTQGVFSVSRNPIYTAFLLPLMGLAYYSLPAMLAAVSLYLFTMTRFVIRSEEAALSRRFGATYTAYCAHTPRWLVF